MQFCNVSLNYHGDLQIAGRSESERRERGCTKANPAKAAAGLGRTDPGTTLSIRIFFPLARKEPFLEAVSSVKLSATVLFYHMVLRVRTVSKTIWP